MEKDKYIPMLCPVCGSFYFSEWQDGDEDCDFFCSHCGWKYDLEQANNHNKTKGSNELSVNEYKEIYQQKLVENPNYHYSESLYIPVSHKCPVCGKYEFPEENSFDICPFCGWEDDSLMENEPDSWEGCSNDLCLNDFRIRYEELIAKNPSYTYESYRFDEKK